MGRATPSDWPSALQWLLSALVIALFITTFLVQAFEIPSRSMENTLLVGDYLLVDRLHYGNGMSARALPYGNVKRGDVIAFKYPVNPNLHIVKRVVGVPGDRVRFINRQLYVNGIALNEPYIHHTSDLHDTFRDEFPRINIPVPLLEGRWWLQMRKLVENNQLIVPDGNYFVLGDNRDDSQDSRYWGFVPRENIIGRPLLIYWSLQDSSQDMPFSTSADDKLFRFAYTATHLYRVTRWDRTFRLVN